METPHLIRPPLTTPIIGLWNALLATVYEFGALGFPGKRTTLTIGREAEADIQLDDVVVSAVHCAIEYRDEVCFLRDVGSTNGTIVNKIPLTEELALQPGMYITLGSTQLIAIGPDRKIPFLARTPSSLLRHAFEICGSDRKAAELVGRSHMSVYRARKTDA